MAPLSTYTYPSSLASRFARVLLPQLDQPSMVMTILGVHEGAEVLKAHPFTAQYPVEGPVVLERDLTVEDRHVLEDDVIREGNDEQQID